MLVSVNKNIKVQKKNHCTCT